MTEIIQKRRKNTLISEIGDFVQEGFLVKSLQFFKIVQFQNLNSGFERFQSYEK